MEELHAITVRTSQELQANPAETQQSLQGLHEALSQLEETLELAEKENIQHFEQTLQHLTELHTLLPALRHTTEDCVTQLRDAIVSSQSEVDQSIEQVRIELHSLGEAAEEFTTELEQSAEHAETISSEFKENANTLSMTINQEQAQLVSQFETLCDDASQQVDELLEQFEVNMQHSLHQAEQLFIALNKQTDVSIDHLDQKLIQEGCNKIVQVAQPLFDHFKSVSSTGETVCKRLSEPINKIADNLDHVSEALEKIAPILNAIEQLK